MNVFEVASSVCKDLGVFRGDKIGTWRYEKILFVGYAVVILLSIVSALFYAVNKDNNYRDFSYCLMILGYLLFVFHFLSVLFVSFNKMRNPGLVAFSVISVNVKHEMDLVERFRFFSKDELELVIQRNIVGIGHIKRRFCTLIGAVENFGVFPAIFATFISFHQVSKEGNSDSYDDFWFWGAVFLSMMYMFYFYIVSIVNQIERLNFIINLAISRHPDNKRVQP
ncbi:hypothetical protein [Thalassospira xiamenensis]|uniref:Uncharacterized protein n=1 Tax=Thalassospira xiamenensis TaxID=220697 RepID=A0A367XE26_9PROT|nr:hypothetical protein [Thalassospira xiamenensis]KZB54606.1 hypothetical protein AUP41_18545 [Thalassospira xiamenensis]RCK50892.1 hypothetical protein TH44_08965 [Thalassospira xiamenensis]